MSQARGLINRDRRAGELRARQSYTAICLGIALALVMGFMPASVAANEGCYRAVLDARTAVDELEISPAGLPESYTELLRYPESLRKEIFLRSAPATQSRFWRDHLSLFLELDLSPEQEKALSSLIEAATPEAFASTFPDSSARQLLDSRVDDLTALVPRDVMRQMVASLGPPQAIGQEDGGDSDVYPCACNIRQDWCQGISFCDDVDCKVQEGCGNFWLAECNGQCCHPWHQDCYE